LGLPINVLVVEGGKLLREGLCALLEKHQDVRVVGEAGDTAAAAKLMRPLQARVVILNLPQAGRITEHRAAVQRVRDLTRDHPEVGVIVLTLGLTPPAVRDFITAGAVGCLTKESASDELIAAIRTAAAGKVYLGARLTQQVVHGYARSAVARGTPKRLAPKETEVLRRIAAGQSNKEIAFALRMSARTADTHRRRIMQKLGRHSVAELTQYAILQGLIDVAEHAEA
jgi:two-component system response regulator NreC